MKRRRELTAYDPCRSLSDLSPSIRPLDQSAQYMKVVAGFNDIIERYKKVDIVLACLTKESDGSYEQGERESMTDKPSR
jgi:hypothetical protein